MIGKRKRETRVMTRSDEHPALDAAPTQDQDIFRQYFESQFEPLQEASLKLNATLERGDSPDTSSDAASISEWAGLSDEDSLAPIEVIEYGEKKEFTDSADDMKHAKAFMVRSQMV
jgi:hypothetical protein